MSEELSPLQKKALKMQLAESRRETEKTQRKAEKRLLKESMAVAAELGIPDRGRLAFAVGRRF